MYFGFQKKIIATKIVVPNKILLHSERRNKDLPEKGKTKGTDGH